jgi:hypothetical protein
LPSFGVEPLQIPGCGSELVVIGGTHPTLGATNPARELALRSLKNHFSPICRALGINPKQQRGR